MTIKKVVLLACGSFSPPTHMHLRMFELARDHLHKLDIEVLFGILSPVHDSYGKKDLVSSKHRLSMLKLAVMDSNWITVSDWEANQESNSRTAVVLDYHQNQINAFFNNKLNDNVNKNDISWIPNFIGNNNIHNVEVKFLCGSDLIQSFETPGLWSDTDIEHIVGSHGLVVIQRESIDAYKFVYGSDVLTKYMNNIVIITDWIPNCISSTKIRRALRRNESVKYLIPNEVISYVEMEKLYGCNKNTKYLLPPLSLNSVLLTPSPVDISMDSPSPTNINCMSICNNNLFASHSVESYTAIDVNHLNKTNILNSFKHPGQAVKIITDSFGEHTIIKKEENVHDSEVCGNIDHGKTLKGSQSCTNFENFEAKWSLQGSKSNDDLKGYKNCDENLIKFIFTKHGIQVISDIETIV